MQLRFGDLCLWLMGGQPLWLSGLAFVLACFAAAIGLLAAVAAVGTFL